MNNPVIIGDATFYMGDCQDVLVDLPDNSIDTIITDPPYGLSFMGKKWDYDVPGVELWKECLRVLKPGGTALIFAGSRTQHRMAVNVEDAGFILKDCIIWLYGSGFPKATDISKQLDKKAGRKRIKSKLRTNGRGASPQKLNNHGEGDTGIGHADGSKQNYHETLPSTPEAQLWDGWKSHGLKPAYEPILVVMKPNEGSYAENALKHGVSGLNINGGRIPFEDTPNPATNPLFRQEQGYKNKSGADSNSSSFRLKNDHTERNANQQGRYPANMILDEEAGRMLDQQSGQLENSKRVNSSSQQNSKFHNNKGRKACGFDDVGGASRFFYCAKPTTEERNRGLKALPLRESPYGKNMSSSDKGTISNSKNPKRNHHPTVKPIKLLEYLCTLTRTPTGGIVLDPFMGSGTTAIACHRTHRKFIGIEKEEKYFDIAVKRYHNEVKQMRLCDL